jgi:hypothetical protein
MSPGSDPTPLLLDASWLNGVNGLLRNSSFKLGRRKRTGSGEPPIPVKITTAIDPAEVDSETGKLTPTTVTVIKIKRDSDGDVNVRADFSNEEIEVVSYFKSNTPAPGANKFRFGYIARDHLNRSRYALIQRECAVFDDPEVPEE